MTDEDRISRRASLKGIAASSALIGGSILGVSSAGATEDKEHGKDKKGHEKGKKDKKYHDKDKKDKKGHGKDKKYHDKDKKDKKGHGKDKKEYGQHKKYHEVEGRVAFNFKCAKPKKNKAKFYLHHGKDTDLKFTYKVAETGKKGEIMVRDDLATAETFWVKAPDGEATVKLYYRGKPVGKATSDPTDVCES